MTLTQRPGPSTASAAAKVTLLVLGAGWTYQFLEPLLTKSNISHVATTTTGHDQTIPFKFDPESDDPGPFRELPTADYVLITFPLKGKGPSRKLLTLYADTHSASSASGSGVGNSSTKWIQFGSTGIYTAPDWNDSNTPIDSSNERGIAEEELISLGGCVLNLAGLYGAQRQPKNWISRVAKTKEQLGEKGALHLIHGVDVARAVIGVITKDSKSTADDNGPEVAPIFGRRWIVADCVSYDWWNLVWDVTGDSDEHVQPESSEAGKTDAQGLDTEKKEEYRRWVVELMQEKNVRGLPRSTELLGRKLDARDFWNAIGLLPERTMTTS